MNIIVLQLKLEAIQKWRQFKNGSDSENIVWVEFVNLELPPASACGIIKKNLIGFSQNR